MIRVAGHFGEWVQGRLGPQGPLALITLCCPDLAVTARRHGPAAGPRHVAQHPAILSDAMIDQLFSLLDLAGGAYELRAEMPVGGGAGASTAALIALARAGGQADPDLLARACLAVEGASDPLMLARPDGVLWASRRGQVLHELPPPPEALILGGFWGAPQRTDPADLDFPDIADLVAEWRKGVALPAAARLASESARRCSALRGPAHDPSADLARDLGALGHVRAHTGSARGLIFAPGPLPDHAGAMLAEAGFTGVQAFRSGGQA